MTDEKKSDLESLVAVLRRDLEISKAQLIESHKMMAVGELLAGIIHEINTPIGSILSNNEVTSRSLESLETLLAEAEAGGTQLPPKALRTLATLRQLAAVDKIACERIAAVVRGLKTFAGGKQTEFQKCNVNEVLQNTLKLAHCEYRRRIRVEADYGDLPEVECEPRQLGQVFLNLLVNAGQAIEGEGTVRIRTGLDGGWVHIAVSDDGSGIAPEHRDRIFSSRFTTKAPGVGSGLGLAISKDIVEGTHGGEIGFESEFGKGTTFHVRIPLSQQHRATET